MLLDGVQRILVKGREAPRDIYTDATFHTVSATGTGKSAMKEAVYFATYEEALAYSEKIEPGEDKRQCGNCW